MEVFVPDTYFKISLQIISHVLAYTSSCINPLLYAFLSENFRKAFRKGIGEHRRQGSHRLPNNSRVPSCEIYS
ncbi:hypothetical protein pipiens_011953 [Culex pipiens pipiens]|uniref:Uncharacterized protein n=1 Tax=Culex pipiens pipiens TaxID=38569 RepID=A0ABD1D495_CULPP